MDYILHPKPTAAETAAKPRIVPSRPRSNLRQGGGRKSVPAWTPYKLRKNRARFDELRPFIKTGVTIIYPASATPQELAKLSKCSQEFCKEMGIPARAVWEGPGAHQHIALCIEHSPEIEQKWLKRLAKRWRVVLGSDMGPKAFLWKPAVQPDKIASYLLKTWNRKGKKPMPAKAAFPWMAFSPTWETCLRKLAPPGMTKARNCGKPRETSGESEIQPPATRKSPPYSPNYTGSPPQTSENEGETHKFDLGQGRARPRPLCPVCWQRWGQSLWIGSCKCNPAFPNC